MAIGSATNIRLYDTVTFFNKGSLSGAADPLRFNCLSGSRIVWSLTVVSITPGATAKLEIQNDFTNDGAFPVVMTLDLNAPGRINKVLTDFHNLFNVIISVTGGSAEIMAGCSVRDNAMAEQDGALSTIGSPREYREDRSNPYGIIYGEALEYGAPQTDPKWRIWRQALFGSQIWRNYGNNNPQYIHRWSDRLTLFPPVPFVNQYSVNFASGVGDYGIVNHSVPIDFSSAAAFSVSLWIKITDSAGVTLLDKSTTNRGYQIELLANGKITFNFQASGTGDRIRVQAEVNVYTGQWIHVCLTKDAGLSASGCKFYMNGVLVTTTVLTNTLLGSTNNTANLHVAANQGGSARYDGLIDEVSLWNATLTPAEVAEVYNGNQGIINLQLGSGQISSALINWWRMGDGMTVFPNIPCVVSGSTMVLQSGVTPGDIYEDIAP